MYNVGDKVSFLGYIPDDTNGELDGGFFIGETLKVVDVIRRVPSPYGYLLGELALPGDPDGVPVTVVVEGHSGILETLFVKEIEPYVPVCLMCGALDATHDSGTVGDPQEQLCCVCDVYRFAECPLCDEY